VRVHAGYLYKAQLLTKPRVSAAAVALRYRVARHL